MKMQHIRGRWLKEKMPEAPERGMELSDDTEGDPDEGNSNDEAESVDELS